MHYVKSQDYKTHSVIPFTTPAMPRISSIAADIVGSISIGDYIVFSQNDRAEGGYANIRQILAYKSALMRERLDYIIDRLNETVESDPDCMCNIIDLEEFSKDFDRHNEEVMKS